MTGPRCQRCGDFLDPLVRGLVLCGECRARGRDPLALARAAVPYQGLARELIRRLKYHRHRRAAAALHEILELWLATDADSDAALACSSAEGLVPVPLHFVRRFWRGFNQAELIAARLAPQVGLPVVEALRRVRPTRPQVGLAPDDRRRNVAGAFEAVAETVVRGGYYLLVDDVYTTGATVRECARVLRRAGAGKVAAVTVARRTTCDLLAAAAG